MANILKIYLAIGQSSLQNVGFMKASDLFESFLSEFPADKIMLGKR
jgi:hypothetical protein